MGFCEIGYKSDKKVGWGWGKDVREQVGGHSIQFVLGSIPTYVSILKILNVVANKIEFDDRFLVGSEWGREETRLPPSVPD